jgi:integrase
VHRRLTILYISGVLRRGRQAVKQANPAIRDGSSARRNGASAHAIMRQTGHSTPAMLEVYARENAPLLGNAVTNLGL